MLRGCGGVAQRIHWKSSGRGSAWLERLVRDQEVGGSNPLAPTILLFKINHLKTWFLGPASPKNHFALFLPFSCIVFRRRLKALRTARAPARSFLLNSQALPSKPELSDRDIASLLNPVGTRHPHVLETEGASLHSRSGIGRFSLQLALRYPGLTPNGLRHCDAKNILGVVRKNNGRG
jgi:hypothetical protein